MLCLLATLAVATTGRADEKPTIRVLAEPLVEADISPMQYGQFVEYLCDLVPSMWAEKLYDNSFEGLSPYAFEYIKQTDFKEKPWYPTGATNRATFAADTTTKVSGDASYRIAFEGSSPATVGISQDGLYVAARAEHVLRCQLRAENLKSPVKVMLHRDGEVLASTEFEPTAEWKPFTATLKCNENADDATLTIQFRGPGTLWLDNASLMPTDTVGGWRPDVVAAVKALKPGVIRFGGSAVDPGDFEWKNTVGDVEKRKPFRAWGGLQPTGPGLEEFVQFCHAVGALPMICVRFNRRTPRDAAEQIEYFNGSADTPMGAQRATNARREPYRIKYWQVGNEVTGAEYEWQLPFFCKAMKEADPSIVLLSSFPSPAVVRNAGDILDMIAPHHYTADLKWMEQNLRDLRKMIADHAPKSGRALKVAVTEWNTTAGDAGPRRAMLWSLANALACAKYQNLLHRHADLVTIANRSNLVNSFCSGIIQTDRRGRLYQTPTYYAQQLYATHGGTKPMKVAGDYGALDISATLSADATHLAMFVINDEAAEASRTIDLSALVKSAGDVNAFTLADRDRAGEADVANSFDDPQLVAAVESKVHVTSSKFDYRFPALSLTVLRVKVK